MAENAVSNKSILIVVYIATIQDTQHNKPPHNMGLNLQAAPVTKVGMPYNNKKKGAITKLIIARPQNEQELLSFWGEKRWLLDDRTYSFPIC